MADRIVRAISTDGMVQAAAICSRDLTERARQIHKTLLLPERKEEGSAPPASAGLQS